MRTSSFAFLPFFFLLPFDLDQGVAAAVHKALPEPAVQTPDAAPAPAPVVQGHRAAPSGCVADEQPLLESISRGTPTRGRLAEGKFLHESARLRHVDAHDCNFWGTDELVGLVQRVARAVDTAHPGHRLTVGELSQREGGDIYGHGSHENGRDVDLGFYFLDEDGLPYEPSRLIDVRRDKTARADGKTVTFDVTRNWAVIEALLTDDEADLAIALVNARVRRWLLAHARATGVSPELRRRAAMVLRVPRRGDHPHRNHFHVRIYCPETDAQCRDFNGQWEWVRRARAERAQLAESSTASREGSSSGPGASPSTTSTSTGSSST